MSDIYSKVAMTTMKGMDREREEMMVVIYEGEDDFRTQTYTNTNRQQPLQSTGNECARKRCYRSATACLMLLCVLLLTAVIVLCVLINTNIQQCHNKNLTEERDQLLTKYTNITEERDKLLAKYNDISYLSKLLNEKKNELSKQHCDGWIYYQYSCYFISSEKKTWNDSRSCCIERGADLIIINNKEEQDFIKNTGKGEHWIGLSDSDVEGRWKWVDGSTLISSFWRSGEPNGDRRENCVESYASEWNDKSCYKLVKWICEKKIKETKIS